MKKTLVTPPKKLSATKNRPDPKEDDGEDEGLEQYGDEENGDDEEAEDGEHEGADDPEEQGEDEHEVSEDKLIAIMQQALGKLEMLQHHVHAMRGGMGAPPVPGLHPAMGGPAPQAPQGAPPGAAQDPTDLLVRRAMA